MNDQSYSDWDRGWNDRSNNPTRDDVNIDPESDAYKLGWLNFDEGTPRSANPFPKPAAPPTPPPAQNIPPPSPAVLAQVQGGGGAGPQPWSMSRFWAILNGRGAL